MVHQRARFSDIELTQAAVEHGMNILAGQPRGMEQALDIRMLDMDRPCECAPGRVISGVDRIRRDTNPAASVPAKVEQGSFRDGLSGSSTV